MSILVLLLRLFSLLAFAVPMLLIARAPQAPSRARKAGARGGRAPVAANVSAFALFFGALLVFPGGADDAAALSLALSGCLVALGGVAIVRRSRLELGSAWSLAPAADRATGLVTSGPYRLVRHPIYLGLALLAAGQALAFASWPAFLIVLGAIVPTFAWRARAEETLLSRTFGEAYALYRQRTGMIIPRLL